MPCILLHSSGTVPSTICSPGINLDSPCIRLGFSTQSLELPCIPLALSTHTFPCHYPAFTGTLHPFPYIPLVFPFFLLLSSDILHPIPCIPVHSPGTYYTYLYITLAFPCFPWHHGLTSIRPPGIPLHSLSTNYLAYIVQAFPGTLLALWTNLHTFRRHSPAFPWHISTTRLNSPGVPLLSPGTLHSH